MEDSKLYSAENIEKLKQKISNYRKNLTTLKAENTVDDYLFLKDELHDVREQVSKQDGVMVMEDSQSGPIEENEQHIEKDSVQLDTFNKTVENSNQDFPVVVDELSERVKPIEEIIQPKTSIPPNKPPSYKQLQGLAKNANQFQEVSSNNTPSPNIDKSKKHTNDQHFNKQYFPLSSAHPNQLYNGLFRNISLKTTIHYEYKNENQAISVKVNENINSSNPKKINQAQKNETVVEQTNEIQSITPVEEKKDTGMENQETKQQKLNKETFSLFDIFRRKQ